MTNFESRFRTVCEEIANLAGHELKNPLTAFTLHNKVLHDMAKQGELFNCSRQIEEMTLKNDKQIRRMEVLLDRIISLVDAR